ncbi:hypothetical protein HUU05_30535, partial [candidate division KSB1 bacterium]|nr:hypothetical protein [candidate division KSB1 bacterium]
MRSSFKKMWRGSALLLILYVLTPSSLSAQPLVQSGTRVDAMGGAFLAVSNDANALQFSPAGLLNTPAQWLAEVGYHRMFLGIDGLGMTQIGAARNFSHRRKGRQVLVPRFVDASGLVLASPAPSREQDTLTQRISFGAQAQIQSFPGYNQNAVRGTVAYGFFPRTE